MASTYVNDLRLEEMATGDQSGTWGTTTNTNLELIAEAFSYGTEGITTNADTHSTIIADGATDPGRSMFLKYTGTLDSTCTITISPNTVSKLWIIENATSGSQSIIIKQGSGATVTIPSGKTKVIYSDGAGSGGAMVDAFASLNLETSGIIETSSSIQTPLIEFTDGDDAITISDGGATTFAQTATFNDDIIIGDGKTIGSASDVDAMTIAANGQVTFSQTLIGTALDISGDIDVDGTTNLDVVDIDGAVDMASTLQVDGAITSSSTINGVTIKADVTNFTDSILISQNASTGTLSSATDNVGIGDDVFAALTSGRNSVAIGSNALDANTSGKNNVAVGHDALTTNTSADDNTAVGKSALESNDTGARNTAVGALALDANTSATNNTAVGYAALGANTTGTDNTAIGRNALDACTTGVNNVAIGESALSTSTTGSGNTAVGKDALAIVTGGDNVAVGKKAGDAVQAHTRNTFIGDSSGGAVNSSDNTFVGQNSGSAITSGDANTLLGRYDGNGDGLDIRTSSNHIVLSDGDGNMRMFIDNNGNMGLGLTNGDAGNAKLVFNGAISEGSDTAMIDFDGFGTRGNASSQSINFRMGRTGFATDQPAQIKSFFSGGGATAAATNIGFKFTTIVANSQHDALFIDASHSRFKFNTDESPQSNNPQTNNCFVIGPSTSTAVTQSLTNACVLINRGGELFAVDSSHNNTQITPHNWNLISEGPSEELAWTYWSERPNPSNPDELQGINVDMAKVVRKVEDLVGEKLIYTENSNMDDHTHQTIISDIQATLADLKTRVENLEG
mgnify:CR=1 FL=1|tara:strand:+ start:665 stop:3052 length:2388 start_codon:yes stop_codon:yes gene_type:complete